MVLEHALTEAVDGGDGGLVHAGEGIAEQDPGPLLGNRLPGLVQQLPKQGIIRSLAFQHIQGITDPLANPTAQLLSGGLGKGDHQDLVHAQAPFQEEAEKEEGNGVGLAGTGAGLDEDLAVQVEGQGVEWVHGDFSGCYPELICTAPSGQGEHNSAPRYITGLLSNLPSGQRELSLVPQRGYIKQAQGNTLCGIITYCVMIPSVLYYNNVSFLYPLRDTREEQGTRFCDPVYPDRGIGI